MLIVVVVVKGGDKLKKIVVVVEPRERRIFCGKDLQVIDRSTVGTDTVKLIIKERDEVDEIAVFRAWRYWYQETKEENKEDDEIIAYYLADFGVKIPITNKVLKENLKLLRSPNFVDLARYSEG